jgi:hypothetical protein
VRSEVQLFPDPPFHCHGAIAQLGERLPCTQEVVGSIPSGSTNFAGVLLIRIAVLSSRKTTTLLFNNLDKVFDVLSGSMAQDYLRLARRLASERGSLHSSK